MSRRAAAHAAVCACLTALLAYRFAGTPAAIVMAVLLPALAYATLLARLDRFQHAPPALSAIMFLWGAGAAALLSEAANDAVQAWLAALQDPASARALTARLAAPMIEEVIKAAPLAGLLLLCHDGVAAELDGIIYGALIGVGFALAENRDYFILAAVQGGEAGLLQSIYLRGVLAGLNHAAFTATLGAAVGWGVLRGGRWLWFAPLLGLALAVAQHAVWNALAAGALNSVACNPSPLDGACHPPASAAALLVAAPLIVAGCSGPPLVILALMARAAVHREAGIIARQLRADVGADGLTAREYEELCSGSARRTAERRALVTGGARAWWQRRRFHRAATRVALLRENGLAHTTAGIRLTSAMLALARGERGVLASS